MAIIHGGGIDQLYTHVGFLALRRAGPYAETVFLTFLIGHAKEAFVLEPCVLVVVTRCGKTHIMWISLKRTVAVQRYISISVPSHEVLRELK